jgi:hypothetical protein
LEWKWLRDRAVGCVIGPSVKTVGANEVIQMDNEIQAVTDVAGNLGFHTTPVGASLLANAAGQLK